MSRSGDRPVVPPTASMVVMPCPFEGTTKFLGEIYGSVRSLQKYHEFNYVKRI